MNSKKTVFTFLAIPTILIGIIYVIPLVLMIFYSFADYNGYSNSYAYVGIDNYANVFNDEVIATFKNIWFYLLSAVMQFIIGTYLAFFVYFQKRFKYITIVIIIIPLLINTVASGLSFTVFLKPMGLFDQVLNFLNITDFSSEAQTVKWIGNTSIVNYTLAIITLWKYTPFTFLLMYYAINSVNKSIVKSAILQGASKFQIAKNIIIPNIKTTIRVVIAMLLVGAVTALEIPKVVTKGVLNTKTILIYVNDMAFSMRNYGLASVLSMVVVGIIIIISIVVLRRNGDEKN